MAIEQSIYSIENRVDLRALRAVVAVADSGSFRQAADDLGYTQSAISHQVATLERALGTKFFSRPGGRGKVMLTPAGQAVCRRGRRALGEVDALGSDVEEAVRGQRLVIRVGVGQTTASELMPGALRAFRQLHPDVGVVLSEVTEGEAIMNALARGRLDLAFAADPDPDERIEAVPIGADPWVILTRPGQPARRGSRSERQSPRRGRPRGLDAALADTGLAGGGARPPRRGTADRLPDR